MELLKPFANTGEKEVFDEDTSPSGNMSLEKGFTQLFELKPEEGGLFILRKKFNQLMYLMSKANVEFNTQSFPKWIADKGDGNPYAYKKGVIVTYTDNMQYVSLINNNTEEPTTGSNWKLADLNNYMDLLTNQDVHGVKSFTSFPVTPSLAPIANYQVANKKYVDDTSTLNLNLKVDKKKNASGDVDLILTGGLYAYSGTLSNLPIGAISDGSLIVNQGINTTARSQILIDASDRMWIRYGDSGGWNSWNEVTTIDSFTQLLTTEGYTKLPNGLILQWGVTVNSTSGTETFPITFPNACFGVQITNNSTNNSGLVSSFNTTSFTWNNLEATTNRYLAIGY